jgi:signal transduction histidine kinase
MNARLETKHAPAERAAPEIVATQAQRFRQAVLLQELANAIPDILVILNLQRQIVYANQRLIETLGLSECQEVLGLRPGEAFNCIHASKTAAGCGTTEFCRQCGAVNAILASQNGRQSIQECQILTRDNSALDLKVWATPYEQDGQPYTVFVAADVSDEKRRQALERVFFHDVLNTAGGVYGLSALLVEEEDLEQVPEIAEMVYHSSERLIGEIQAQRQLNAAERGDLKVSFSGTTSMGLMTEVAESYAGHPVAEDRQIEVDPDAQDVPLSTDSVLARRVLGNMVKNALEATDRGGTVSLTCTERETSVVFAVHNPIYMPRSVQLQVFKRSFSTKGVGRGIGTFSIKLLGETYLGGSVWFSSTEEQGTTFFLMLPVQPASGPQNDAK